MLGNYTVKNRDEQDKLRQIPKWTKSYASNRVLLVIISLCLSTFVAALIGILSGSAGHAFRDGNFTTGYILVTADIIVCLVWLWLIFSGRLNQWFAYINVWLYRGEGQVTPTAPIINRKVATVVAWTFGLLVCATPIIAQQADLPIRYLQPLTAVYCVPFLIYLWWAQGKQGSIYMLIWPAGYTLHSILILAGVPMVTRLDPMLQILLPMTLWGIVAVLASHIYSRYALRKIKELTQRCPEEEDADA